MNRHNQNSKAPRRIDLSQQIQIEDAIVQTMHLTAMTDKYCQLIEEEIHHMHIDIENMIGSCSATRIDISREVQQLRQLESDYMASFDQSYQEAEMELASFRNNSQQYMNELKTIQQDEKKLLDSLQLLTKLLEKDRQSKELIKTEQDKLLKIKESVDSLKTLDANLVSQLHTLNFECFQLQQCQRKLNNQLQEARGNIRVYCRIRPISSIESNNGNKYYSILNQSTLSFTVPKESLRSDNQKRDFQYNFERVFDQASQEDVFNELSPLIQSIFDGINVCIFAYGQTGSGKTYTMEGRTGQDEEGVIPRSVSFIIDEIDRLKHYGLTFKMRISVMEIYLEKVIDLLNIKNTTEEPDTIDVVTVDDIMNLLAVARSNRKVAQTQCNSRSSRSHCIFKLRLLVKSRDKQKQGILNLVDLAGSERISQSKVEGDRMKETAFINKSLTQLNTVITSLVKKEQHIPYRNSKLTHVLQQSLSGNSKTLMMVMISPLLENVEQTICSLRFAQTVTECIVRKN